MVAAIGTGDAFSKGEAAKRRLHHNVLAIALANKRKIVS
jgi:hypothetical protein